VPAWLDWALPAVLVVGALAVIASSILVLTFDWELQLGEGINSYFTSRFAHGGPLYADWTSLTPYFPVYPPGFYLSAAPLELIDENALWPGRLISMIAFAFAGWAAWRIAVRLGCQRLEAAVSALGFLSIGLTGVLMSAARPDALAIGLFAGALLAATRWEDERDRTTLIVAIVLTAAGGFVKYNFAPLALAIAISFWLRDRRSAWVYAGASAGLAMLAFAITDLASSGAFLSNTRDFSTGYAASALRTVIKGMLLPFPNPLLVIAGIEVALALLSRSLRAVHLAWLGGALILLSAIKIGSAANYVAPFAFTSSVLAGLALMRTRLGAGKQVALGISVVLALLLAPAAFDSAQKVPDLRNRLDALDTANSQAAARLASAPGPVFGDRNDLTLAAGKGPAFDNAPMTLLWQAGKWDTSPLIGLIQQRKLGMIESGFDLNGAVPTTDGEPAWPTAVIAAARSSYCPLPRSSPIPDGDVWLYVPCHGGSASQPGGAPDNGARHP
jgi:dolichyl-phosphate-mannose-protein mannosyltransferase